MTLENAADGGAADHANECQIHSTLYFSFHFLLCGRSAGRLLRIVLPGDF